METKTKTKTCRSCGEVKPLTSFQREAKTKDGHRGTCRACRSVAKTPTTEKVRIKPELKVWLQEFERVCTCVECGEVPVLQGVETVEEAREALRSSVPRCMDHQSVLNLKARLRARTWPQNASQSIDRINFLHDITVTLKNFPHEHRRDGASAWLAGDRTTLTEDLVDLMLERVEYSLDLDAKAALREQYPILTTERRWSVRSVETYASEYEAAIEKRGGDLDGNTIFDLF